MKSTKNTKNTKNRSLKTLINKGFLLFLLVFFVVLAHPSTTAVCCSWWCQNSKHQEQPRTVILSIPACKEDHQEHQQADAIHPTYDVTFVQ